MSQEITSSEVRQAGPALHVAPSPHLQDAAFSTRRMMTDVLLALVPLMVAAVVVFRMAAIIQVALCVAGCMASEILFARMRGRKPTLGDCSAIVTGVILAFSLPWNSPWFATLIGAFIAMSIGKAIFGGLGFNIFNPAMVGRAFVMFAFTAALAAPGYKVDNLDNVSKVFELMGIDQDVVTAATPMTAYKEHADYAPVKALFLGNTNGSIGETSALACIIGGLFLCIRRTASWEIPASSLITVAAISGVMALCKGDVHVISQQLLGGALLFGAFFILTDPVTSPITFKGKVIFGIGFGALVMIIRELSGYPEGVMFAVLLMNSIVPLINRWTVPKPFGGVPAAKKA